MEDERFDNRAFYEGHEYESEIIIYTSTIVLHIWEGYFEDIVYARRTPDDLQGFARDYQKHQGPFNDERLVYEIEDVAEYLLDLYHCRSSRLIFDESVELLDTLIRLLEHALAHKDPIRYEYNA